MPDITENMSTLINENAKLIAELKRIFIPYGFSPSMEKVLSTISTVEKNNNEMKVEVRVINGFIEGSLGK